MKNVLLALSVLLSTAANAANTNLIGTWILEKSENPMPDGSLVSYCTGVHGMIIYTKEGYVSVALNCDKEGTGKEPADISGRKFFYTGTYQYKDNIVNHKMLNASQPELIGSSFDRTVEIKDDLLVLTGINQGQKFSAFWRKVKKAK